MFTVKLVQGDTTHVLSCNHYAIYKNKTFTELSLYKDFTTQNGVTYNISSEDIGIPTFEICYVENINGKTINVIEHVKSTQLIS